MDFLGPLDKNTFEFNMLSEEKRGKILPLLALCENECFLAKYPAPLWILPQYRAEGETER